MKDRNALRGAALATPTFKVETVKDALGNEYEVRQPTIRERSDIRKAATTTNEDGTFNFDPLDFMLRAAMACTFVPETNDRVFEPEDYDVLVSMPAGSLIDDLSQVASKLCNVEGKLADAKKD